MVKSFASPSLNHLMFGLTAYPNMAEYGEGAGGGDPLQGSAAGLEKAKQAAAAFIGELEAGGAQKTALLGRTLVRKKPRDPGH